MDKAETLGSSIRFGVFSPIVIGIGFSVGTTKSDILVSTTASIPISVSSVLPTT